MGVRPCSAAAILILLSLTAGLAGAGTMERLLMPGEVTRAHAKLEDDCAKCHEPGDRTKQTGLCLDCHKDVATDITKGQGFHGKRGRIARCSSCHAEHEGRDADIVRLDRTAFNHRQTDFPLTGAHGAAGCDSCHSAGKRFREAQHDCAACHRKQDPHGGRLGADCSQCHDTGTFKPARFDHSRTSFPLRDAHAQASCAGCHRDQSYKGAPHECAACHAPDDVHRGTRGSDCAQCHNVRAWRESGFNHARVSGYSLLGRHARIGCDACHRGGDLRADLPRDCRSCHSAVDRHGGRFGQDCSTCHTQDVWKVAAFDHVARGRYALDGAHARLDCHTCHTGALKEQKLGTACVDCHRTHDVHRGSMGKDCASCHRSSGWRDSVRFDHDLAGFPLVGLHVSVACEECHSSRAYRGTPRECVTCHKPRDVHQGSLGRDCASCHNPNGWDFWQFDHGQETHFALTGSHTRVSCQGCHTRPAHEVKLSSRCVDCHRADDTHDARLGSDCGRCHQTESFKAGVVVR